MSQLALIHTGASQPLSSDLHPHATVKMCLVIVGFHIGHLFTFISKQLLNKHIAFKITLFKSTVCGVHIINIFLKD